GTAVRAVRLNDANATVGGSEGQEVFAENLDLPGRAIALGELFAQQRGHPEAAQEIAHRRAWAAACQEVIVSSIQHQEVALSNACSRSAMMSSTVSIPIDRRSTSGPAPAAIRCSSVSWRWVVEAGWMI